MSLLSLLAAILLLALASLGTTWTVASLFALATMMTAPVNIRLEVKLYALAGIVVGVALLLLSFDRLARLVMLV